MYLVMLYLICINRFFCHLLAEHVHDTLPDATFYKVIKANILGNKRIFLTYQADMEQNKHLFGVMSVFT